MGTTSNKAKQRWNDSHYTQIKVSVQPEIAAKFKAKCQVKGVSMASEISRFMSNESKKTDTCSTRQKRRKALGSVILLLEEICDAEKEYWDNIPINLQNGERYEAAEQAYTAMEEALGLLHQAY
jgi:adenine specific DNA methylase Mod